MQVQIQASPRRVLPAIYLPSWVGLEMYLITALVDIAVPAKVPSADQV